MSVISTSAFLADSSSFMSVFLLLSLFCVIFLLNSVTSPNIIASLLLISLYFSITLALISEWNGYFLVLVFVGGLLVSVFYLSSLTLQSTTPLFFFLPLIFSLFQDYSINQGAPSYALLWNVSSLSLLISCSLLLISCVLIGQFLLTDNALRSLPPLAISSHI